MNLETMQALLDQFDIDGRLIHVEGFGSGHINQTFAAYLAFDNQPTMRYIVQKVNTSIFTQPEKLMGNIISVTQFLRKQVEQRGGDPDREVLSLVKTKDGGFYYNDPADGFFRVYRFIENATCYQMVTKELLHSSAKAFGAFARSLDNFDASGIFDVIENFHNTVDRYSKFQMSVAENTQDRAKECVAEIDFVEKRKDFCSIILKEIEAGTIPLRVCHNDTKLNNVMIDNTSNLGICVIDLDTIMKGSLLYDFGDSIRFGASSALEDEENLDLVFCDLEKYEAYVKGYLEETKEILSPKEFSLLAHIAILLTLECGMRFLTDFLQGDTYFRTHKEKHNLIRCRNQFKLVADMEEKLEKMININEKYQ